MCFTLLGIMCGLWGSIDEVQCPLGSEPGTPSVESLELTVRDCKVPGHASIMLHCQVI
jgi:hypothetical protein